MASKLKTMYVGGIVERDLEVFEQIKEFSRLNYNVKIVNLLKKGKFTVKYFKKKLKKYPISLLMVKLYSEDHNQKIYEAIHQYASGIPRVNSLKSVKTCESRRDTFQLIQRECKKLKIPHTYYSINKALHALEAGTPIIIKLDTHNIRNFSKYDRIIGVAYTPEEFREIIRKYDIENNVLFFQEYLGKFDIVYKVYIIDNYVQTITSQHLLQNGEPTPLELIHMRVDIDSKLRRRLIRLGRKFGMSIFGVDYILKDGEAHIVDVNDFPSFRNIPEAVSLISNFMHKILDARENLGKLPLSLKARTYMA